MASADPDIRRVQREVCGSRQVRVLVKDLEDFCKSEDLSLEPLRTKIRFIPPIAVRNSSSLPNACSNSNATVEIVECLLEAYSQEELPRDGFGLVPLHRACANESIDPKTIQLLLDFWPDSVRQRSTTSPSGRLPMHFLCNNGVLNDAASLKILSLLLEAYPEAVYEATDRESLPIHFASQSKSWAFCKVLLDIHPESARIVDNCGRLPIHCACSLKGSSETVKNLYDVFPDGVNAPDIDGDYPIHFACGYYEGEIDLVDIITFLLAKDPSSARLVASGDLPLHIVCGSLLCKDNISLDSAKLLFDVYPDAIEIEDGDGNSPVDLAIEMKRTHLVAFLQAQYAYAARARDEHAMTTRDGNGRLPLHHALADGACLGATKLLVRGNPAALQVPDIDGRFPVHIACEFGSLAVAQFLIAQYDGCLSSCDSRNNYPLHVACRGGSYDTVNFLLAQQTAFVSKTNADGRLPIHLLLEPRFGATWVEVDQESQKLCLESIYRLLVAYPDTLTQTLR